MFITVFHIILYVIEDFVQRMLEMVKHILATVFQTFQILFWNQFPEENITEDPNNNSEDGSGTDSPPPEAHQRNQQQGVHPRSVRLSATSSTLTDESAVGSRNNSIHSDSESVFHSSSNTLTASTVTLEVSNPTEIKNLSKQENKPKNKEEMISMKKIKPVSEENIDLLKIDHGKPNKGKESGTVENGCKTVLKTERSSTPRTPITKQPTSQNKQPVDNGAHNNECITDDEDEKTCVEKCCICTITCLSFCCE